jgi:hypothetical protein
MFRSVVITWGEERLYPTVLNPTGRELTLWEYTVFYISLGRGVLPVTRSLQAQWSLYDHSAQIFQWENQLWRETEPMSLWLTSGPMPAPVDTQSRVPHWRAESGHIGVGKSAFWTLLGRDWDCCLSSVILLVPQCHVQIRGDHTHPPFEGKSYKGFQGGDFYMYSRQSSKA